VFNKLIEELVADTDCNPNTNNCDDRKHESAVVVGIVVMKVIYLIAGEYLFNVHKKESKVMCVVVITDDGFSSIKCFLDSPLCN
jgi:hypothetical protein